MALLAEGLDKSSFQERIVFFWEMGEEIFGAMATHWSLYPPNHRALSFQTSVGIKWGESDL